MVTRNLFRQRAILYIVSTLALLFLVSCATTDSPTPCPEVNCPEANCPQPIRYEDLWNFSGHANQDAEAFNHWNEDDPQEIPVECAKCHSRPGFIDFLGVDGSNANRVDKPAKTGTMITCFVCHNEATDNLSSAVFPSGKSVRGLGPEARCVQCHQGQASTRQVNQAIDDAGLDDDSPSERLTFINSHSISGATPFGAVVQGAYEYTGKTYRGLFNRGDDFFACTECHDQHSLALKIETCSECHTINGEYAKDIRVDTTDFDGDGDVQEGISYEIDSFLILLLDAIQVYAADEIGAPIAYSLEYYPYFFIDSNVNGEVDEDEAVYSNRYITWTPRLLKAAYNYNYVLHDPGAFAHNSDYVIQVLYDSLEDIGTNISGLSRPE